MIARIDRILFVAAQWFTDRFQRLTGLTKFWLEKWSFILGTLSYCFGVDSASVAIWAVFLIFYTVKIVRGTEKHEAIFLRSGVLLLGAFNHSLLRRSAAFVLFLVDVVAVIFYLGVSSALTAFPPVFLCATFVLAYVYFSACIPRPPGKSKLQEWSEKLKAWARGISDPAPAPTSIPV